jgi:hypothetical protein
MDGWREELRKVFRLLLRLIYAGNLATLKLLVTTSVRCDTILQELSPQQGGQASSLAGDMIAGEVVNRPMTEAAIIADIKGLDTEE